MSRLFELSRPWRAGLALASVFGSGLVSYATVLNSHAPAAFLVLSAAGCLFEASIARRAAQARAWMALAGGAAGLAAVIDLAALVFLVLLVGVIAAMHWAIGQRILGVIWYGMGALPPLTLHAVLTIPVTGDVLPGFLHPELRVDQRVAMTAVEAEDDEEERPGRASMAAIHFVDGVLGPRGLLTHFPVILFGAAGIGAVMHRHWPASMKTMAVATLGGAVVIVLAYITLKADWSEPMFSVRWFILFMPLLVFWAGAWARKRHSAGVWAAAAALLGFSVITSLIGAAAPFSAAREGEYSAYAAARFLMHGGREAIMSRSAGQAPTPAWHPVRANPPKGSTAQSGRFGRG